MRACLFCCAWLYKHAQSIFFSISAQMHSLIECKCLIMARAFAVSNIQLAIFTQYMLSSPVANNRNFLIFFLSYHRFSRCRRGSTSGWLWRCACRSCCTLAFSTSPSLRYVLVFFIKWCLMCVLLLDMCFFFLLFGAICLSFVLLLFYFIFPYVSYSRLIRFFLCSFSRNFFCFLLYMITSAKSTVLLTFLL